MNDDILNLYKSIQSQQKNEPVLMTSPVNQLPKSSNGTTLDNESTSFKRNYSNDQFLVDNALTIKRKREKCSKGLRHFSMKVCEKVKQKNVTSYNEVADELVSEYCGLTSFNQNELSASQSSSTATALDYWSYDQKNVRRRVYDALNVLMAMNIISKEKKEIKWIGLPCNKKQECQDLEVEKKNKQERINDKSEQLRDLILEQIALKSLIERNRNSNHSNEDLKSKMIKLPFLVLSTDKKTNIDFTISNDKKDYSVQFDNAFEVNSHVNILKRINLKNENNKTELVPKVFEPYLKQLSDGNTKLEPLKLDIDLPNYQNLVNFEKELQNLKLKKKKASNDQVNEASNLYEEDDDQLSNEDNIEESDDDGDDLNNMDQNTDDENSTDNDEDDDEEEENSLADSISF